MEEMIFMVENAPEGGYIAKALGESIFTEAENLEDLRQQVRDAVKCHLTRDSDLRLFDFTSYTKKSLLHETSSRHFRRTPREESETSRLRCYATNRKPHPPHYATTRRASGWNPRGRC